MVPALSGPGAGAAAALEADRAHVLARTEALWRELRGARLLVTGGTGFVGSWMLEALRWANEELTAGVSALVLTRDPEEFNRQRPHLAVARGVRLHRGDIRTFETPGESFTHVIHGAASADAALYASEPLAMLDTIVQGTRHTLERAVAARAGTVLLISSGAVYGRQPLDIANVREEYTGAPDPLDPSQVYAEGKRTAEMMGAVHARQSGLDVKIARLFAFVGPYLPLDRHLAVGNFIRDRLAGGPIAIKGDGSPLRSYLYGADLAVWLWTILVRGVSCRPYNVGSDRAVSIAEVAQVVAEAVPPSVPVTRGREPRPSVPSERYVPDTSRARTELGLEDWIGLEEGVRRTLTWATAAGESQ
jgi:nucleoside-diphosphate-sugar epimerase